MSASRHDIVDDDEIENSMSFDPGNTPDQKVNGSKKPNRHSKSDSKADSHLKNSNSNKPTTKFEQALEANGPPPQRNAVHHGQHQRLDTNFSAGSAGSANESSVIDLSAASMHNFEDKEVVS